MKEPRDPRAVRLETTARVPAEPAWDALADPAILSRWFTTNARADLRAGGRYENGDGDRGEFLAVDRPRLLRFTWENPGHCPGTVVEFRVEPEGGEGVRIRLEHSGIATAEGEADMRRGWTWALESLRSFLETGRPVPHEEWMKSHPD